MNTLTLSTPQEFVARGAGWLDATRPGWADRIDLDTLNLKACSRCVLGQLDGWFEPRRYGGWAWADAHGFNVGGSGGGGEFWYRDMADLETHWRIEIQKRRRA